MNLKLEGVGKSFRQGQSLLAILNELDLTVASGEVAAIVGESGSGKSTLLSLLAGFERPDRGRILWDGENSSAWSADRWAAFRKVNLGFVFQSYHLIPYLNAIENVALPLRLVGHADPEPEGARLLGQLGLGQRLAHLPSQLSGGECQRVAIARALIHGPKLLLADEPTGSLDHKTGEQVLSMLFRQIEQRQQTALIVTHSHEVARRCHRILTLKEGRLWST